PMTDPNPLLALLHAPPGFDAIRPEHVEPAITKLLHDLTTGLEVLEANVQPTWQGLVEPIEQLVEPLRVAWGAVTHLTGVRNSPALRAAHEAVQPEVVRAFTRLGQSRPLHAAAKALLDGP